MRPAHLAIITRISLISVCQLCDIPSGFGQPLSTQDEARGATLIAPLSAQSKLNTLSLELSARSTPPSEYGARRFKWLSAQEGSATEIDDVEETEEGSSHPPFKGGRYLPPPSRGALQSLLERARGLGGYLPRATLQALGQGFPKPLNQSQSERRESLFSPDQHTHLKSPPLRYTSVYTPSVAPHARETVYNGISDLGDLYIKSTHTLKPRAPLTLKRLVQCLEVGASSLRPTSQKTLFLGKDTWVDPAHLSLTCARSLCRQAGFTCYLGSYELQGWSNPKEARGISSVAPSQQLVLTKASRTVTLSSDEADNLYISSLETFREGTWLHLLVGARGAYFSGSWRSSRSAGATLSSLDGATSHLIEHASLALELPQALKRKASELLPRLGVNRGSLYHDVMFKLTSWHRAFTLGELAESAHKGTLYERLFLAQKGVCRHRSYSFVVSARALGIPARLVVNAAHAFAEVMDPSGAWRRVDLGGEGPFIERPLDQHLKYDAPQEALRDGLPQPPAYRAAQRSSAHELQAYYQRPLAEQRRLQAPIDRGEAHPTLVPMSEGGPTLSDQAKTSSSTLSPRTDSNLELLGVGALYSSELSSLELTNLPDAPSTPADLQSLTQARGATDGPQSISPTSSPLKVNVTRTSVTCPRPSAREAKRLRPPALRASEPSGALLKLNATLSGAITPLRCSWVKVTGQATITHVTTPRQRRMLRSALRGVSLQLEVSPGGGGEPIQLKGWGVTDRRGRFTVYGRLPMSLPQGPLELKVHAPAQGPWPAVTAPVHER